MRRFASLIITSIVLSCYTHAQDLDTTLTASILIPVNEKGYAEYTEVVTTDSVSKDLAEKYPHNWSYPNNKQMNREWKKFQVQTNSELRFLIDDLKKHMDASKKKDEW